MTPTPLSTVAQAVCHSLGLVFPSLLCDRPLAFVLGDRDRHGGYPAGCGRGLGGLEHR
jgi:hypothetical protein